MKVSVDKGRATARNRTSLFFWIVAAGCAAVLAVTVGIFLSDYEVLAKGQLLPYTSGIIYKVRFHDMITLYIEPEVLTLPDLVNAYIMTGIGFAALTFSLVISFLGQDESRERFWFFFLMFSGMTFLAADESLGFHETMGHNMQFLGNLPFIKHPDDAIILSYGVPAAAFLIRFYKLIFEARRALIFFALAFISFLISGMADVFSVPFEELIEPLASIFIFAALVSIGLHHTRVALHHHHE